MIRWLLLSTHNYWYNNAPENLRQLTKWFQNLNQTCSYKWYLMCDDLDKLPNATLYDMITWDAYVLKFLMNDRSVYFSTNVSMICFD